MATQPAPVFLASLSCIWSPESLEEILAMILKRPVRLMVTSEELAAWT